LHIPDLKGHQSDTQYTNITFFTKGGMGEIYKAYDQINNIDVAVKLIPVSSSDEEKLLSREITASSELSSDNLVKTYYTDEIEIANTKYFYIVQHFYINGNMRSLIKKDIPLEDCLKMIMNILKGLQEAHTKIVHRDLKPENILIDEKNNLVITDFGLAKFINEKTKTNSLKGAGTIPYMSPECWLHEDNSIQMDIYSLGIIFYEILAGEFPFNGKTEQDWRDWHLFEPLPDISKVRSDVPIKVKQILSKMTQKRANNRYSKTIDVINALHESIKQNLESNLAIDRLASIGHNKSEAKKKQELTRIQEKEKIENYKKFLNYHITELSNQIKEIIESVNSRLEDNKITIKEHNYNGMLTERSFSISVDHIFASFKFYEHDVIKRYEEERISEIKNRNTNRHGFMYSSIPESIFKQKDIIYLGMVETNYMSPILNENFGFNLALVKNENDTYGTWYIAKFSDSGLSRTNRKEFALDLEYFFKEFEKSFVMHLLTVEYRELTENDLHRIIEEILKV